MDEANLELVRALRSGETQQSLECKYGIKSKVHSDHPNLIGFSYSQILSPMHVELVREARGIVLDRDRDWTPVCLPFKKFFNIEETLADDIDWDSACIQRKYDGSMVAMWEYHGRWHVSTTGTPDACGSFNSYGESFGSMFRYTVEELNGGLFFTDPVSGDNTTYLFEFIHPMNRIVVQHETKRVVLLAMRDRTTGEYLDVKMPEFVRCGIDLVEHIPIPRTLEAVRAAARELDGFKDEGFVVVDKHFNRVKVKSPDYVYKHRLRFHTTRSSLMDTVRLGEISEVASVFPEFKCEMDKMEADLGSLSDSLGNVFRKLRVSTRSRKEFALAAQADPVGRSMTGFLFRMLDTQKSAREVLSEKNGKELLKIVYGTTD